MRPENFQGNDSRFRPGTGQRWQKKDAGNPGVHGTSEAPVGAPESTGGRGGFLRLGAAAARFEMHYAVCAVWRGAARFRGRRWREIFCARGAGASSQSWSSQRCSSTSRRNSGVGAGARPLAIKNATQFSAISAREAGEAWGNRKGKGARMAGAGAGGLKTLDGRRTCGGDHWMIGRSGVRRPSDRVDHREARG